MRIVVWNCRMAFARKRELLFALKPDVAVIPECSRDAARACAGEGYSVCWWGDNKHKGLAVIAGVPWALDSGRSWARHPAQKWIAPVKVNGPTNFLLVAVWACPVGTVRELNYVGQLFQAVKRHKRWFSEGVPTVICGDFNSNAILDRGRKIMRHTAVVGMLAERNLLSAYHAFFSEEHGKETRPTHYLWHRESKPFHLDYIFLPRPWIQSLSEVSVGSYAQWRSWSDHMPVVVDFSLPSMDDARPSQVQQTAV